MAPLPSAPVQAAAPSSGTVTIEFEAEVTLIDDPGESLGRRANPGDVAYGVYVYDETAPDEHQKSDIGRYRFLSAPCGIEVVVNDLAFVTDPAAVDMTIRLLDNKKTSTVSDHYQVNSARNLDVIPGIGVAGIDIELVDGTATALSSDALAGQRPEGLWHPTRTLTITGADGWLIVATIAQLGGPGATAGPDPRARFHED